MKALVIGRHSGQIGMEIDEQRSVQFPATSEECKPVFEALLSECFEKGWALVFQGLPGQMATTIAKSIAYGGQISHVPVGVIVSKPGERPAGKQMTFDHNLFDRTYQNDVYYSAVEAFAKHCNPNAKVDGFTVTVDAPMQFVFSHIEWFA
jgi:hypothetical protein